MLVRKEMVRYVRKIYTMKTYVFQALKDVKSLLKRPAKSYRTVRATIVGQGRAGKTATIRCVRNGLCVCCDRAARSNGLIA